MSSSTTRWCSRQTTVVLSNKWVVQFWKKWAFFNTDFSTYFKMCCMVCCIQIVLSCLPRKPPQSSLHPLSVSYMIVSGVMMMECGLVTVSVSPRQYSDPDQLHSPPVTAMCTHVITGHWTLLYTATVSSPWISTLSTNVPGGDMTMQCQYHIQYPDQVVLL